MTMLETQQSILDDLALLGDGLNRMDYLLGCAREAPGLPPEARTADGLVADCQVNTWLLVRWEGETLRLRTDSESLLIKGALSDWGNLRRLHESAGRSLPVQPAGLRQLYRLV